ncbi:MAG: porin [Candidatus Pelagibacter sp.]
MDKLKKVGLTALGTALVSSSAVAADMSVTGSAKLTLVGGDKQNTGNGWSMLDSINFSGSADLDNGWTVSTSQNTSAGTHNNTNMSINMGDMGSLTFWKQGGTSVPGSWDDMMPAANEESWHGLTGSVAGGNGAIMAAGSNADMFRYTVNVMDGVDLFASYSPSDAAVAVESSQSWGVQYTGIEGLTVGYASGDNNEQVAVTNGNATDSAAGKDIENTAMFLKYAFDSFTVGYQANESDSGTASADQEYRGFGISYAVTEDLSVSYGQGEVDYEEATDEDQETSAIGVSFTSGGITVSASHHNGDNLGGTAASDKQAYELNIAFAF